MAVQSGRRSQTLNKDLKGCKEGCGEEGGGEGAAMVIILVVLKKKKRERKENTHMEQQQAHPVLVQLWVVFFLFF